MQSVLREMRHALRKLRKDLGFTTLAVLTLGLGLGATLYMFTFVKAYLLSSLPFPDAERIMHIEQVNSRRGDDGIAVAQRDFVEWRRAQQSFVELAAFYIGSINLSDDELPTRLAGAFISPSAFDIIHSGAQMGRTLSSADAQPGAPPVAVLGYDLWQNRYNGDPQVLGKTIRVNGVPTSVVGVMPEGFEFPFNQSIWVPLQIDPASPADSSRLQVFGRLKPGVTLEQARAEFANISASLGELYAENKNVTTSIKPFEDAYISSSARTVVAAMFGAVLFVLLIACANVANLILVRTAARQKEIAVRTALGADRWRIVTHVLTESVLLASLGALLAAFLADRGLDVTNRALIAADKERPFWVDLSIDWKVLVFAAGAAMFAGVIAGLVPALSATRTDVIRYLKDGAKDSGMSASKISRVMVIAEVALSCVLLVCSGLMIRSIVNLQQEDLGIRNTAMLTGRINLLETKYPDKDSQLRFFENLVDRFEADAAVVAATAAWSFPGIDGRITQYRTRATDGSPADDLPMTNYAGVMSNYLDIVGLNLVRGRWFDSRDRADSAPVVVIDQGFAERVFASVDPIGQEIMLGGRGSDAPQWLTIIGVTERVLLDQPNDPYHPAVFVPLPQAPSRAMTVAVRTVGDPIAFAQRLRETVFALDRDTPVYWVRTLDDWIWVSNFTPRLVSTLFGIFALIALILSAVGVYGVLSYSVTQRAVEIGVRRAVGASGSRIIKLVVGRGMLQLGIGLGVGLLFAILFSRFLSSMLHGVAPFDPLTLVSVTAVLIAVGLLASLVPALRAIHVDPVKVLRSE